PIEIAGGAAKCCGGIAYGAAMSQIRFGKHPPKFDYRNLRFGTYAAKLGAAPDHDDVLPRVYSKVGVSDPAVLFPMDGNDTYGDCTIAAVAHAITIYR